MPLVATRIVRPPSPYKQAEFVVRSVLVLGLMMMVVVFSRRLPLPDWQRTLILVLGGAMALIATGASVVLINLEKNRLAKLPGDPNVLDDEQFHTSITCAHRSEVSVLQMSAHDLSHAMATKERAVVCLLVDAGVAYSTEEVEVLFTPTESSAPDGIVIVGAAHADDELNVTSTPADEPIAPIAIVVVEGARANADADAGPVDLGAREHADGDTPNGKAVEARSGAVGTPRPGTSRPASPRPDLSGRDVRLS